MSKLKPTPLAPSDPITAPPAVKARTPRQAKSQGPTNRVVTDVAGDETLVLNCSTEESAIVAVTGKYSTRIIGISDAVKFAQKSGARVIDLAELAQAADPVES